MKNLTFLQRLLFVTFIVFAANNNVFAQKWKTINPDILYAEDKFKNVDSVKVGIGLPNPLYPLHVKGQIFADSARILGPLRIGLNSLTIGGVLSPGGSDQITSSNGVINFGNTGTFSNIKVGIGTIAPADALDVIGAIALNAKRALSNYGTRNIFVGEGAGINFVI